MTVGETEKFAPLALVPTLLPPEATVYHLMVLPADVALRLDEPPVQIVACVAVSEVGIYGNAFTVTDGCEFMFLSVAPPPFPLLV